MSKELIRRIVHRHLNEVRHCFETGSSTGQAQAGTVRIKFTIGPTGSTSTATVVKSDLEDRGLQACLTGAIKRWTFPGPEGGRIVVVTMPFSASGHAR